MHEQEYIVARYITVTVYIVEKQAHYIISWSFEMVHEKEPKMYIIQYKQ